MTVLCGTEAMRAKSEKAEGEPGQGGPLAHNIPPQARFDTLSAVHDPGYNDLIRRLDESDHVPRPAARRVPTRGTTRGNARGYIYDISRSRDV